MTKYEHKIIEADTLTRKLPSGAGTLGGQGWRVVGAWSSAFGPRIVLEREVSK